MNRLESFFVNRAVHPENDLLSRCITRIIKINPSNKRLFVIVYVILCAE